MPLGSPRGRQIAEGKQGNMIVLCCTVLTARGSSSGVRSGGKHGSRFDSPAAAAGSNRNSVRAVGLENLGKARSPPSLPSGCAVQVPGP